MPTIDVKHAVRLAREFLSAAVDTPIYDVELEELALSLMTARFRALYRTASA